MTDGRTTDLEDKIGELEGLDGTDAAAAMEAMGRMMVALDAREADGMIGLAPVADSLLDRAESAYIDLAIRLANSTPGDVETATYILRTVAPLRLAEAAAGLHALAMRFLEEDPAGHITYYAALFAFHGEGTDKNLTRAYQLHEAAAAKGGAASMFELHVMSAQGLGCEADEVVATQWCAKAAEAGNVRAMSNLGGFYATGRGVPVDLVKSVEWYERAAELGHGGAAATLGVMFASGADVDVDAARAKRYFSLAEDLGFDWCTMAESVGLDPSAYA